MVVFAQFDRFCHTFPLHRKSRCTRSQLFVSNKLVAMQREGWTADQNHKINLPGALSCCNGLPSEISLYGSIQFNRTGDGLIQRLRFCQSSARKNSRGQTGRSGRHHRANPVVGTCDRDQGSRQFLFGVSGCQKLSVVRQPLSDGGDGAGGAPHGLEEPAPPKPPLQPEP